MLLYSYGYKHIGCINKEWRGARNFSSGIRWNMESAIAFTKAHPISPRLNTYDWFGLSKFPLRPPLTSINLQLMDRRENWFQIYKTICGIQIIRMKALMPKVGV